MSLAETDTVGAVDLANLLERLRPRANSLIVTVFGDSIMPRGGKIWLSDLVGLMEPFGLSDRLVRTGVYRLSQEGMLISKSIGRRAEYSLSETGLRQFLEAGSRIYASKPAPGSNLWTLVQGVPDISQAERQTLRKTLKWHGFGQLSTTLMAAPGPVSKELTSVLESDGLDEKVLIFSSTLEGVSTQQNMKAAAAAAWPLEDLNKEYTRFLKVFARYGPARSQALSPRQAFALRTLLIHEYRKILLKDPHLPDALLPQPWKGAEALSLTAQIYKNIAMDTDAHVANQMAPGEDAAPALSDNYWQRFGGLAAT